MMVLPKKLVADAMESMLKGLATLKWLCVLYRDWRE